jgi:internalin A
MSIQEAERLIQDALESETLELNLRSLGLTAIPESLYLLSRLQNLYLDDNRISAIPENLGRLVDLRTLILDRNQISAIPESLSKFANLQRLDFDHNQISAIPESLSKFANLHTLYLGSNQISTIPESLSKLANLQLLYLGDNRISTIPETLSQLASLHRLYLGDNQISTIPESMSQLVNLMELDLSGNQIDIIPESLGRLANLRALYLIDNQISTIPEGLGQLANLQTLCLNGNQIKAIPDSLGRLANLRILNFSNNQLTNLPEVLGHLSKLTALYLHGNPGLGIPEEILGPTWEETIDKNATPKPPAEILSYFKSLKQARPLHEAKLILVGQGAVGKTSLVKALTTGKFNRGEETTEGIKISDWSCPIDRSSEVKLHIWDFGGQEMMHSTHQFFLTRRSLYLLVLNRRQGGCDREADYWFRLISAFGGEDAPVVVALNKQKSEPFDVNRGGWLEKYAGNIHGFVETDCDDPKSIARLKKAIQEQLRKMESLKASFPSRWFAIKDQLSNMRSEYLTFDAYREICRKHGEEDPNSQNSLAGFLHDLGIALNYKDEPRLRFAYVLRPEWVTEGIYALIHAFVAGYGLFSQAEAESVLGPKGYSQDAVHFITGLMEKFELSFPLGDRRRRILIAQLLADQQPEEAKNFNPSGCLNFGYEYTIVPEGLLPRFIVRTHHLSAPDGRWKSGVILRYDGCKALVRSDSTAGQVRIHVDGPEAARPQLLAIIRHNFEVIHSDYEFQPVELVYAPGAPDKSFRRDELEDFLRSGMATIPVRLSDRRVINQNIAAVIEPIRPAAEPLKLFLSYAHKDAKYLDELRKDLKLMERNGLIRIWSDHELIAGHPWEQKILQELQTADVIICQLSRDFLDSDFCTLKELEIAIQRKTAGEAELIAYVLKDCGWQEVPRLKEFQVLPPGAKPLTDWKKDKYWRAVAEGIQRAVVNLQKNPRRRSGISRFVEAGM